MMIPYKKTILLFLLPLLIFFLDAESFAADKNALINNVLKAHGGKETLSKIKTIIIDSKAYNLYKKERGTRRVYVEFPDKLRVETKFKDSQDILILNNRKGWKSIVDGFIDVRGGFLELMSFSYRTTFPPRDILSKDNRVVYSGIRKKYDKIYEVLEVYNSKNMKITLYIDPQNFLIKRAKTEVELEGKSAELEKSFTNFKKVNGVLYPFSSVNFTNGLKTIQTDIDEVVLNPQIGDKLFNP